MTDILQEVAALFDRSGEPVEGFDMGHVEAEAEAIMSFTGRPYCLVRAWSIIEVDVSEDYKVSLATDGLSPYVLYASDVVLHSGGKRRPGDWVRSTFQRSFTQGFLFETKNTTYLLMGPGLRKKASVEAILAIVS
ncbi:hypothetical protein QN399_18825 [Pseudomonas sp. 10C3]|uniref:DUF6957 family protein n=1 Tax=Pseudomonas sp. 10C3 TaxID=3118753 RepID=UPI002E801934|nr:hypothetical protein [Pseudomonas sp. 10C3]MEE3508294.1 hypothetical protein [Pseudomonas sp. 10C3]